MQQGREEGEEWSREIRRSKGKGGRRGRKGREEENMRGSDRGKQGRGRSVGERM